MLYERLIALSISNLLFMGAWVVFLHDGGLYQLKETPERPIQAFITLILLVLFTSEIVFRVMRYFKKRTHFEKGIFYGALLLFLGVQFNHLRGEIGIAWRFPPYFTNWVRSLSLFSFAGLCILIFTPYFILCIRYAKTLEKFHRNVGAICIPAIAVCLFNSIWIWKKAPTPSQFEVSVTGTHHRSEERPRVVWILFDELDQSLVFENTPKDVELDSFHRFYSESFKATKAFSPGPNTLESIPGLLTQKEIARAQYVFPPNILLNAQGEENTTLWNEEATIFLKVRELGFKTGLLGWYHAYCTILGSQIDDCERRSHFRYSRDYLSNIRIILKHVLYGKWVVAMFIDDVLAMDSASQKMLSNPDLDFVFIHFPVPHSPWIYDRNRRAITRFRSQAMEGYFDNLVLADDVFGEMRAAMEKSNLWENSTVILSSDHSWRLSDEIGIKRDFRVPFVVKLPHAKSGVSSQEFHTSKTGQLILDIFKHKIPNAEALSAWFAAKH